MIGQWNQRNWRSRALTAEADVGRLTRELAAKHEFAATVASALIQITNDYHRLSGLPDTVDDETVFEAIAARLGEVPPDRRGGVVALLRDFVRVYGDDGYPSTALRAALAGDAIVEWEHRGACPQTLPCNCDWPFVAEGRA